MIFARRLIYGLGAVLTLAVLLLAWLAATESGTRFLLARAAGLLPPALTLHEPAGTLLRGVDFTRAEWRDETLSVVADDLHLRVRLLPLLSRRVYVDALRIGAATVAIAERDAAASPSDGLPSVSLPIYLRLQDAHLRAIELRIGERQERIDVLRLAGEMDGSQLQLDRFELSNDTLELAANGRLRLRGDYPGRINLEWRWLAADAHEYAGSVRLQGALNDATVSHRLTAPFAVDTDGQATFIDGNLTVDLENRWASIRWPTNAGVLAARDGRLRIRGSLSALEVELDTHAGLDDFPETHVELAGLLQPASLRLDSLTARNELGTLTAAGDLAWDAAPEARLDFELSGVDPSRWLPYAAGRVGARGVASASFPSDGPAVQVNVASFAGDLNGHALGGRARLDYAGDLTRVSDAELTLGSNRASGSAEIADAVTVDLQFDLPAIAELRPDAAGSLRGRLFVRNPQELAELRGSVQASKLAWNALSVDELQADFDLSHRSNGSARITASALMSGDTRLDALTLAASGRLEDHSVEATLMNLGQTLDVAATNGSWAGETWQARLRRVSLSGDAVGQWRGSDSARIRIGTDGAKLDRFCVQGPNAGESVCVAGGYTADGRADVDAELSGLPLAALPLRLPTGVDAHGVVNARFTGELRDRRVSGDASLALEDASISSVVDGETIAVVIEDASGSAEIRDNRMRAEAGISLADAAGDAGLELTIDDLLDPNSGIAGRGNLRISDAALFAVLIPQVTNPRGRIGGSLAIGGKLPAPEFTGEITLDDGSFGVRPANIEIVDVSARLAQLGPGALQLDGRARSGGGEIRLRGRTIVSAETGIRSELELDGQNFELARLPDWRVSASPDIDLVFDERRTTVTGALTIPVAEIRLREVPRTAVAPSPDVVVHRPEGNETIVRRRVDVAVRTDLGDDVSFSGFGLTTGLEGSIDIQGGTHAPWVGRGRLGLRDGRYVAYGQELDIEHGELIFNGPLTNPNLDIRAVRRAGDVTAGIQLAGSALQPRSSVYAEPAMSDADALSYLLTGRPMSSATGEGDGAMLNSAAFALGLAGAGSIVSEIRGDLGLETLALEGGGDESRIVAGKRIGDRLLIEYGYGLIDKLGTLLLRYQINERLVLESRTGTVSNLDLVYRVRKR